MIRTLLAVVLGIAVAVATVTGIETLRYDLWPVAAGLDRMNMNHVGAIVLAAPLAANAMIVLGWTVGSFLGGLAASLIAPTGNRFATMLPGVLIALGCAAMGAVVPHTYWMPGSGAVLSVIAGWAGAALGRRLRRPKQHDVPAWRGYDR